MVGSRDSAISSGMRTNVLATTGFPLQNAYLQQKKQTPTPWSTFTLPTRFDPEFPEFRILAFVVVWDVGS
jgi:hypothetical protein